MIRYNSPKLMAHNTQLPCAGYLSSIRERSKKMKKYEMAKMQHAAHNWETFKEWVIVPLLFLGVMMLCGFVDSM